MPGGKSLWKKKNVGGAYISLNCGGSRVQGSQKLLGEIKPSLGRGGYQWGKSPSIKVGSPPSPPLPTATNSEMEECKKKKKTESGGCRGTNNVLVLERFGDEKPLGGVFEDCGQGRASGGDGTKGVKSSPGDPFREDWVVCPFWEGRPVTQTRLFRPKKNWLPNVLKTRPRGEVNLSNGLPTTRYIPPSACDRTEMRFEKRKG